MRYYLSVMMALCLSCSVYADEAADRLQTVFTKLETIEANFQQWVKSDGIVIQESNGHMAIARPEKFRWYTEQPLQQLIVGDGVHVWIYDIDLEQVTIKSMQQELGNTPMMLLSGEVVEVLDDYHVTIQSEHDTQVTYHLTPKSSDANFAVVTFTFQGITLLQMSLIDQLEQTTELEFTQVKTNHEIEPQQFEFEPPAGVDVIGSDR